MPTAIRRYQGVVALLLAWVLAAPSPADPRRIYDGTTNPWLDAVGHLHVPGQSRLSGRRVHHREDCSATLLALPGRASADTVVTAWHCLERYGDLSKPILFSLHGQAPIEARRLADGGGMYADWALLRLQRPVPGAQARALAVHPAEADAALPLSMAGYSRDHENGAGDRLLSYDPACHIRGRERGYTETDCSALKGASGGAVVQVAAGQPMYCGVVSAGDGAGRSRYVPVALFRQALQRHLR